MTPQRWIPILAGLFVLFCIAFLRPVPIVPESKCHVVEGEVTGIIGTESQDIFIRLKDNPTRYYINRGLEQGLAIADLRQKLVGQEVILKYPPYWTPLDPNNKIRHISKVEFQGETLFSELRE
ncbi:MAG: hypothetical protein MRY78_15400 [Saprospiraceae bacterium]|nr:hypothetical protein [Saprospiraceae bacterium]